MTRIDKIVSLALLEKELDEKKAAGNKTVFTNGCFDILHAGHVRYLNAARAEGDVLVIGLNSDASVRVIKGPNRPLVTETLRAEVLAGLACVDYIVLFDEPDPYRLIQILLPDVLVKGADWAEKDIIGADIVRGNGGQVVRVDLLPEVSTSKIIEKILKTHSA